MGLVGKESSVHKIVGKHACFSTILIEVYGKLGMVIASSSNGSVIKFRDNQVVRRRL